MKLNEQKLEPQFSNLSQVQRKEAEISQVKQRWSTMKQVGQNEAIWRQTWVKFRKTKRQAEAAKGPGLSRSVLSCAPFILALGFF